MKLMQRQNLFTRDGFTLLELLVVISIIGIIAAIVLASVTTARTKGRDASRLQQIGEVENALELYFTENGQYPSTNAAGAPFLVDLNNSLISSALTSGGFLPRIPVDLEYVYTGDGTNSYAYCSNSNNGKTYVLHVNVETDNDPLARCYIQRGTDLNGCTLSAALCTSLF